MNKITYISLLLLCSYYFCPAQNNYSQRAFIDTDNHSSDYLFPQDSAGNINISEVISCGLDSLMLANNVNKLMFLAKNTLNASVKVLFNGLGEVHFLIQIPVGTELFSTPAGVFPRAISKLQINVAINYRQNRYKYELSNFYTFRRRITGTKAEGQSNIIHFSRVDALNEYYVKANKRDKQVYDKLLKGEIEQYNLEFETYLKFIQLLNNTMQLKNDDANWE